MSQASLAKRLNISPSTVGMYEQGRRVPPNDILVALSAEFNVAVDYLLAGDCYSQQDLAALSQLMINSQERIILSQTNAPYKDFSKEHLAVQIELLLIDRQF